MTHGGCPDSPTPSIAPRWPPSTLTTSASPFAPATSSLPEATDPPPSLPTSGMNHFFRTPGSSSALPQVTPHIQRLLFTPIGPARPQTSEAGFTIRNAGLTIQAHASRDTYPPCPRYETKNDPSAHHRRHHKALHPRARREILSRRDQGHGHRSSESPAKPSTSTFVAFSKRAPSSDRAIPAPASTRSPHWSNGAETSRSSQILPKTSYGLDR